MAGGTRGDPLSAAESAAWWAANRERWMAWAFADEPPDGLSDWTKDPWHGWIRKRAGAGKAKRRGAKR